MIRRPPRSTPLSLHDALPISLRGRETLRVIYPDDEIVYRELGRGSNTTLRVRDDGTFNDREDRGDRKSTRLNSSHTVISYAVFCLKKKKKTIARGVLDVRH